MAEMKNAFLGRRLHPALDSTRSVVRHKEIIVTLLIAIGLVIMVVYLFLQGWRATLIPLLAVPVSLVGTFVLFPLFGFSINTLVIWFGAGDWPGGGRRHRGGGSRGTSHRRRDGSERCGLESDGGNPAPSSESHWSCRPYLSPPLSFRALQEGSISNSL
jgi:hypothetical protein